MVKHTPGPWHRNIPPARKYPTVWAGRNTHVAVVVAGAPRGSGSGETMSDDELEANVNLIAAAPDMLEALRSINKVASPNPQRTFDDVIRDLGYITACARSAIAKAEVSTRRNGPVLREVSDV